MTNQIVETMIKFRQDKVVFVADIENMFFIYESLLCFLWWQDGDISRQPVDYEMFVHVFGGTSSPPHLLMGKISLERKLLRPCRIFFVC